MKRRDFIRSFPLVAGIPFAIGGVPVKLFAERNTYMRMAEQSTSDNVLIILQLHGGNDGLNTIIPIEQYDQYYSRRANIAIPAKNSVRKIIPLDSTLPSPDQIGLHPDMNAVKELYDQGRVKIIQGVSYKNNNGSHFRGRDIWFMGGGFNDYYSSGWVGRYLKSEYAPQQYPDDFPNSSMLDPLAIELGSDVSLIFHQEGNIPTSISLGSDPVAFANLIDQLDGFDDEGIDPRGLPPVSLNNSPYGKELNWILNLEDKSEDYAQRLLEVYENASTSGVTYPETYPFNAPAGNLRNSLSPQLQLIARLLDGGGPGLGVKTKVFLVKLGGFDTHATQVESYDPTMGVHASKLYHISSAMKAFQQDLRLRGIEDRVLTVTTSEFGRRISSNGSFGTDHGTGAPLFIFGKGVIPGMIGTNPDLTPDYGNIAMQYDYRQVYANILLDWMGVDQETITNDVFFGNFINGPKEDGGFYEKLPIAGDSVTGFETFVANKYFIDSLYPNPASEETVLSFHINHELPIHLTIMDVKGRIMKEIVKDQVQPGAHKLKIDVKNLNIGLYVCEFKAGIYKETKKLLIRK
jgi:uncharacterized protein (DUF1501 family)